VRAYAIAIIGILRSVIRDVRPGSVAQAERPLNRVRLSPFHPGGGKYVTITDL